VIGPTGAVRVLVATKPVDFRKGAEGLAALVRETMKADPFSGAVYVFRARRADRVKLIFWDGTGVVLVAKRLEDGGECQEFRAEVGHDGSKGAHRCRDAKSPVFLTPFSTSFWLAPTQRAHSIRMACSMI